VIEQYNKENAALTNKIHEVTSGSETHDRIIHELRTQLRSHAEKSETKIRNERRKLEDAHERESRQAETLQAMEREREETRERLTLAVHALDKAKQEREDLLAIMQGIESKLTDCETRRYEAFQKWEAAKGELEDCRLKLDTAEATAAAKTRETELIKRKMAEMGMGGFNSDSMMTLTQRSKAQGDAAVEVAWDSCFVGSCRLILTHTVCVPALLPGSRETARDLPSAARPSHEGEARRGEQTEAVQHPDASNAPGPAQLLHR